MKSTKISERVFDIIMAVGLVIFLPFLVMYIAVPGILELALPEKSATKRCKEVPEHVRKKKRNNDVPTMGDSDKDELIAYLVFGMLLLSEYIRFLFMPLIGNLIVSILAFTSWIVFGFLFERLERELNKS